MAKIYLILKTSSNLSLSSISKSKICKKAQKCFNFSKKTKMIYIDKKTVDFPESLNSETTVRRRKEVIEAQKYLKGNRYNSRYKSKDIKAALEKLYANKCAFCETNIERWDVEHFRPKSLYPHLAFSWDNLLLACPTCNGHKTNHFETQNSQAQFEEKELENIHHLAEKYNKIEKNRFVHPELEQNIEKKLIFDEQGGLSSEDENVQYTIDTCQLDREKLNIERKKQVLNHYFTEVLIRYSRFQETKDTQYFKNSIEDLRKAFKKEANNPNNNFIAFRKFAEKHIIL